MTTSQILNAICKQSQRPECDIDSISDLMTNRKGDEYYYYRIISSVNNVFDGFHTLKIVNPDTAIDKAKVIELCEALGIEWQIHMDNSVSFEILTDDNLVSHFIAHFQPNTCWDDIYQDLKLISNYSKAKGL